MPLSEKLLPVVQAVLGRQVRGHPSSPQVSLPAPAALGQGPALFSLLVALFQEVLPPELFDLLVLTLCQQAPAFASSLNYAKLVTAVLTMYQSQVSKTRLVSCRSAGEWSARATAGPGPCPGVSGGLLAVQRSQHLAPLRPRSPQPTGAVWLPLWIGAMRL